MRTAETQAFWTERLELSLCASSLSMAFRDSKDSIRSKVMVNKGE